MDEGFLRQRRNLMIVCCLLFLLSASGAGLEKVGFAGFEMKFSRPAAIFLSLWLAFAYYLYRYYVYFSVTGKAPLVEKFRESALQLLQAHVHEAAKRAHGDDTSLQANLNWQTAWAPMLVLQIGHPPKPDEVGQPRRVIENFQLHWPRKRRILMVFRRWLSILLNDTVVTDYAFPFFLAVFTLLYASNRDWQGSFAQIAENW